ncbi:hypothetical protein [Bifidobacterium sp. SO1]|uniref:hypothetical protein n=1 Tax=Bifidobacterium sp. SO1 TaxID=2809029 RepID=UPI001BDC7353|nr:hypothetical protein [Bifidobacterium sp. SO1]MBT1162202.1 hypothetical protein [Bifidobacterium sp. SO1]
MSDEQLTVSPIPPIPPVELGVRERKPVSAPTSHLSMTVDQSLSVDDLIGMLLEFRARYGNQPVVMEDWRLTDDNRLLSFRNAMVGVDYCDGPRHDGDACPHGPWCLISGAELQG